MVSWSPVWPEVWDSGCFKIEKRCLQIWRWNWLYSWKTAWEYKDTSVSNSVQHWKRVHSQQQKIKSHLLHLRQKQKKHGCRAEPFSTRQTRGAGDVDLISSRRTFWKLTGLESKACFHTTQHWETNSWRELIFTHDFCTLQLKKTFTVAFCFPCGFPWNLNCQGSLVLLVESFLFDFYFTSWTKLPGDCNFSTLVALQPESCFLLTITSIYRVEHGKVFISSG